MPKETSENLDYINKAISGLTLSQLENIFRDPRFKKMFEGLTKTELKKLKIDVDISGIKDVEELEQAFLNASGASEEYFRKLDKYRSVTKAMNLAFREGSTHMREYLEAANKSGGRMAVVAAASTYLLKGITDLSSKYKDSLLGLKRYNIEQEKFQRSSLKSAKDIGEMRGSLNLVRKDMTEFFGVISKSEVLGVGIDQLKQTFLALKAVYGDQAMEMIQDYQNILTKMPDLNIRIRSDGDSELTGDEWYEILKSGNVEKVVQLRAAGLMGGEKQDSTNANLESHQKRIEFYLEKAKDMAMDNLPVQTLYLSQIGESGAKSLTILTTLAGVVGGIRSMMLTSRLRNIVGNETVRGSAMGVLAGFGGKTGTTLSGVGMSAGVAASVGGLAVAAAAAALALAELKLRADQGYTPTLKERENAVLGDKESNDPELRKGFLGTALQTALMDAIYYASKGDVDLENGKIMGFDLSRQKDSALSYLGFGPKDIPFDGRKAQKTGKYTADYANKIKGDKGVIAAKDIYGSVQNAINRFDEMHGDVVEITQGIMDIASVTGEGAKYFSNMSKYSEAVQAKFDTDQRLINDGIQKAREQMNLGVIANGKKFMDSPTGEMLTNVIKASELDLVRSQKAYNDAMSNTLEKMTFLVNQGAKDYPNKLRLQLRSAEAASASETAVLSGGEIPALQRQRKSDIKTAEDELAGINKAIKQGEKDRDNTTDMVLKTKITRDLVVHENTRTQAIKKLNDAIKNTEYIDAFTERMRSAKQVISSLDSVITSLDGSFSSLQPVMAANLKNAEKMRDAAREEFEAVRGHPEANGYQLRRDKLAIAELDVVKEKFEYAQRERDLKLSSIDLESGWMNEQADFYAEMGGHFGDVLSMRTSAIQKERESIGVLENYLSSGLLSGRERMAAEIELERKKMNITRESIGIQKDAYEKFVGMAFGKLSDIGFKRGRMDDAVLMGTAATRVKNRAGMYAPGSGYGMNRDQQTALTATGFNAKPMNYGGYVDQEMIRGELQAKQASGLIGGEVQKVDVQTHVTVEPSKEFNVIVKETVINVMKTMGKSIGRTN